MTRLASGLRNTLMADHCWLEWGSISIPEQATAGQGYYLSSNHVFDEKLLSQERNRG
jgi:hypothetical protein